MPRQTPLGINIVLHERLITDWLSVREEGIFGALKWSRSGFHKSAGQKGPERHSGGRFCWQWGPAGSEASLSPCRDKIVATVALMVFGDFSVW